MKAGDSREDPATGPAGKKASVQPYKRVLACYDGSDNAMRAIQRAASIAKDGKTELSIVVAADTLTYSSWTRRYFGDLHDAVVDYAKENLSRATGAAKAAGAPSVEGTVEEGYPADVIIGRASDLSADLIVVGRRGVRGVRRYLMGSVSAAVVDHSSCDVLVVK
jgi:nucleotide-binding universal stress UspA family protein